MESSPNPPLQSPVCPDPVFIIGAPRSGTSILAWSLAQHSRFWTSGESHFLSDFFRDGWIQDRFENAKRMPKSWLELQDVEKSEFMKSLGLGVNTLFSSRSQGKRWIDQTPSYTLIADDLAEMFPGALFVHILRDGRRVVHSLMNFIKLLSAEELAALEKLDKWRGQQSFSMACRAWEHFVEAAMDFGERNPDRCLTVVNEQLVANPTACFQEILRFLGAPEEEAPAEYFRTHRLNSSFRPDPGDPDWVRRLSEPWKQWTGEQSGLFWVEAGEAMVKYGLVAQPEGDQADLIAQGAKNRALSRDYNGLAHEYNALERWAHDLEARLIEREAFIRRTRRNEQFVESLRVLWRRVLGRDKPDVESE